MLPSGSANQTARIPPKVATSPSQLTFAAHPHLRLFPGNSIEVLECPPAPGGKED
ncbi:MAG TPA: hypothetical protein PLL50_08620 [Propionicimonas sp.]|nr:hypothetical protein [Propionicimonas sp.]HQA78401.1 hypothetical protein [Propionicimonas sp.]HQD97296.1 hypothetical protein [Propionicimonas sp.]